MDPTARLESLVRGDRTEASRRWLVGPTGLLAAAQACAGQPARARLLADTEGSDLFAWLDDESVVGPGPRPSDRARAIVAVARLQPGLPVDLLAWTIDRIRIGLEPGALPAPSASEIDDEFVDDPVGRLLRWVAARRASPAVGDLVLAVHGGRIPARDRTIAVAFAASNHDAGEILALVVSRTSGSPGLSHDIAAAPFSRYSSEFAEALESAWESVGSPPFAARWHVSYEHTRRPVEVVVGRSAGLAAAAALHGLAIESLDVDRDLVFTGCIGPGGSVDPIAHTGTSQYRDKLAAAEGRRLVIPERDHATVAELAAMSGRSPELVPVRRVADLPHLLERLAHGHGFVSAPHARQSARTASARSVADRIAPEALPEALRSEERSGFVGRTTEMAMLHDLVSAPASTPRLCLIRGQAGAGKSRLVRELARRMPAEVTVLFTRCEEVAAAPLAPLTDLVASAPAARAGGPADVAALRDAYARWLTDQGAVRRVVVVVEDAHWAPSATLALLRDVVMIAGRGDITIVVTYRSDEQARAPELAALVTAARRSHPQVVELAVEALTVDDVVELLTGTAPELPHWQALELAERLHRMTSGNALFLTELLAGARPNTLVADLEHVCADPLFAPASLDEFVRARLRRITNPHVLAAAATIGDEFDYPTLRHVADVGDEVLLATLAEAGERGFVTDLEDANFRYRFAHAVVRSIVYRSVSRARRTQYHARAAEVVERTLREGQPGRNAVLAYHYSNTAPLLHTDRAIEYGLAAGDEAAALRAFDEAEAFYLQAVEHARDSAGFATLVNTQLALGRNRRRRGHPSARHILLGAARRALELRRTDLLVDCVLAAHRGFFSQAAVVDDVWVELIEKALEIVRRDCARRAELLAVLAAELTWSATDSTRRFALADEALDLAERAGDPQTLARVRYRRSLAIAALDTVDARDTNSRALVALTRVLRDDEYAFIGAITRATVAAEVGLMDEALVRVSDAEHHADALREAVPVFSARLARAGSLVVEGQLRSAEATSVEALHLGQAAEVGGDAVMLHGEQMWEICRVEGRYDEIVDQAVGLCDGADPTLTTIAARYAHETGGPQAADAAYRRVAGAGIGSIPRNLAEATVTRDLAYLAVRFKDTAAAADLYERLGPAAVHFGNTTVVRPCGHHYLGMLASLLGRHAAAEHHFSSAVAMHERQRCPLLLAETLLEWGVALAGSGGDDEARGVALVDRARFEADRCGAFGLGGTAERRLARAVNGRGCEP